MSEKEKKAEQIINLYFGAINGTFEVGEMTRNAYGCALIHVQGIIDVLPMYTGNLNPKWKFYSDVKEIIENKL